MCSEGRSFFVGAPFFSKSLFKRFLFYVEGGRAMKGPRSRKDGLEEGGRALKFK